MTTNKEESSRREEKTDNTIDRAISMMMLPLLTFSLAILFFFDPTLL